MRQANPIHRIAIAAIFSAGTISCFSQVFVQSRNREPQLHVSSYKQVAMGDIVGPIGVETERSLDFRDDLTSKIFNSNTYEVLDRNSLAQILSAQKNSAIKVIDENVVAALGKKLNEALLITGRMQTEKIDQKLYSSKNGTCAGNTSYYWLVTGEVGVQMKIIDIKTGKMIFSGPVTKKINVQSKQTCEITSKFNTVPIIEEAFDGLSEEVAKLIIPYTEQITVTFIGPAITLFKNPFKKLDQTVAFFNAGDFQKGMEILKAYAADASLKDNLKSKAHFNYAMGFFCIEDYTQAKAELKQAMALNPTEAGYQQWVERIDKEIALNTKKAF